MKLKKANGQQAEVRRLEWWESLPPGERKFLCHVMQTIRTAKGSQWPEVARAAAKWEAGLSCFIKVRLKNGASRWQRHGQSGQRQASMSISVKAVTSCPSTSRSLPGAFPDRD
jgi:hypothetical protein